MFFRLFLKISTNFHHNKLFLLWSILIVSMDFDTPVAVFMTGCEILSKVAENMALNRQVFRPIGLS